MPTKAINRYTNMKILFITNMYPTRDHPVFGIFVKEQIDDISRALNLAFDLYFINARFKGNLQYLLSIFLIPFKILKTKYDIVHIHYGFSGLFLLFYRPKSKIFLTLHGADILAKQGRHVQVWITKKVIRKVDKVYILNEEMEEIVKPLNSNYELLPCGVNINFFKPGDGRTHGDKKKTVLFSNDPKIKVKNFPLFIDTIQLLKERSPYEIDYKCIHNLSRQGVKDLYNQADCLLMTSISEGSPQVVKEALACNLPVVSVPVGDVPVITAGIPNCYISKKYSPDELCALVIQSFQTDVRENHSIRDELISKGKYDHLSITKQLIKNYNEALGSYFSIQSTEAVNSGKI